MKQCYFLVFFLVYFSINAQNVTHLSLDYDSHYVSPNPAPDKVHYSIYNANLQHYYYAGANIFHGKEVLYVIASHGILKVDIPNSKILDFCIHKDIIPEIRDIFVDKEDALWFMSDEKLYRYKTELEQIQSDSFNNLRLRDLAKDSKGSIWVLMTEADKYSKIFTIEEETWKEKWSFDQRVFSDSSLLNLAVSHKDEPVFYYRDTIRIYTGNEWKELTTDRLLINNLVYNTNGDILINSRVVSNDCFLLKNEEKIWKFSGSTDALESAVFDKEGNVVTKRYGYINIRNQTGDGYITHTFKDRSISKTNGLSVDYDGNIWTLTDKGLLKLSNNEFTHYNFPFLTSDLHLGENLPIRPRVVVQNDNSTWTLLDRSFSFQMDSLFKVESKKEYVKFRYHNGQFSTTDSPGRIVRNGNKLYALYTNTGILADISKGSITVIDTVSFMLNYNYQLCVDDKQNFLISTFNTLKLYRRNEKEWHEVKTEGNIKGILKSSAKGFYVYMDNKIMELDIATGKFHDYANLPASTANRTLKFSTDDDNSLFLYDNQMLYYINPEKSVTEIDLGQEMYILSVEKSSETGFYVNTFHHLSFYDLNTSKLYRLPMYDQFGNISRFLFKDLKRNLWSLSSHAIETLPVDPLKYIGLSISEVGETIVLEQTIIRGINFGKEKGTVFLGGQVAEVIYWSDSLIKFRWPGNIPLDEVIVRVQSGENENYDEIKQTFTIETVLGNEEFIHTVYPNPTSEIIRIKTTERIRDVYVADESGRTFKPTVSEMSEGYKIDLPKVKSGNYVLCYFIKNKQFSKRILIL